MDTEQTRELTAIIEQFSSEEGMHGTAIPGLSCVKLSEANARLPTVYTPCVCVIVRGQKKVMLESETYTYRPTDYLAVSVDLPVISEVTENSAEHPYFGLQIDLDQQLLSALLMEGNFSSQDNSQLHRGIFVGHMDHELADSVVRLARLLKTPDDINMLAPVIRREIFYRLLKGEHGSAIAQFAQAGSHMHRIAQAIQTLKSGFDRPVKVEELANSIGMSVSSFHAHFKTVTAMSPLQYQKRIRLLEARQIMLVEKQDAAATAYRVGYESPSQFSREYSRMFGNPPGRDIERIRGKRSDHRHDQLYQR